MLTRPLKLIIVMGILYWCVAPVAAQCPLDHLIIGCNRDGVIGTADDRKLFVDCSQKYRHSGETDYAHWFYPLRESASSGYRYRVGEPGFDRFQDSDEGAHQTYDPNRALLGAANVDYRLIVECVALSAGLRAVHDEDPQFTLDAAGGWFNHSYLEQLRGETHVHLSYEAIDGENLHWITLRLRDGLNDGDQYEPSEPFTIVFNREPFAGDLCIDGSVDWLDLLELSGSWMLANSSRRNDYWERTDTDRDGFVMGADFARLAENWKAELVPGWQWIETGFNYILMDLEFPEGQSRIGYAVGESATYRGEGIIIKTLDGGDTWTRLTPAGIPGLEAMSFVDLQTGYAAGWDGYVIKTRDGGATWNTVPVPSGMLVVADLEFRDPNHGVLIEDANVYVTEDGGATWATGTGISTACHEAAYADEHTVFIAGGDGHIFKSVDGGHTWTTVYTGIRKQPLLGVDFLNADYGIAVGDYSVVVSTTDGGATWSRLPLPGDLLLDSICIVDRHTAYLCGTPEYVFKTPDEGATWISDYDGNYERAFNRIRFTADGTGFICGSGGVILRKAGPGTIPPASPSHDSPIVED